MEFMALKTDDFDFLAFLLFMGPLEEGLAEELEQRMKKIEAASPEKRVLALDVRGVSNVKTNPIKIFTKFQDKARENNWEFYLCNIPRLLQPKLLKNEKTREKLNVFKTREDFFSHLEEKNACQQVERPKPIPVVVRTPEGIRLLQGKAIRFSNNHLYVQTTDKNARVFKEQKNKPAEISFETEKFQMPAREALVLESQRAQTGEGFLLTIDLTELLEQDLELLDDYFACS